MAVLGAPVGLFSLGDSDRCVGSFITRRDVAAIFCVGDNDLCDLKFEDMDGVPAIDERKLQKAWYNGNIPNSPPRNSASMDELILTQLVSNTLPEATVEPQQRVGRFKMDLKVTYRGITRFIEFDGPSHFALSQYGAPKHHPFRKKRIVEDKTGIEVVNWAYWIQRCASNVLALFDESVRGLGALWSTNIHFGDFHFEDSAEIVQNINNRFNSARPDGSGYFYGPETEQRNNPEHPGEYHHLFPVSLLEDAEIPDEQVFRALNCALITWRTNRTISNKNPIAYLKERADNSAFGEDELKRRLRTHLIPYARLAVGYDGVSEDERRFRVKNDYAAFLSARAKILAEAGHLACEGKALELSQLLDDAN